jgi:hypothetical protein
MRVEVVLERALAEGRVQDPERGRRLLEGIRAGVVTARLGASGDIIARVTVRGNVTAARIRLTPRTSGGCACAQRDGRETMPEPPTSRRTATGAASWSAP